MDERQTQIRQGQGLEESRLNREFIDWLQRWSTPFLLVFLAIAATYVIYQRVQQSRIETVNQAFMELEAASGTTSPNPRALEDIARTYRNVRGVPHMANLFAADEYLRASRLGVAPGSQLAPDGTIAAEDVLTEEQQARYLAEAERLYRDVLAATEVDANKAVHALGASYGLAAIAETRGELEQARAHYERIIQLAERTGYQQHASVARQRMENVGRLSERPRLFAAAELPRLPGTPDPAPMGAETFGGEFEGIFQPTIIDLEPGQEIPGVLEVPGGQTPEGGEPAGDQPTGNEPAQPDDPAAPR